MAHAKVLIMDMIKLARIWNHQCISLIFFYWKNKEIILHNDTENWYANFGLQLGSLTTNSSVLYHKIEKYQQMSIRQYWKIFTFFSLIDSMIAIRFLEAYVIWKYFVRVYADRDCAIMYYWPISAQCCISYRNQVAGFYIK